MKWTTATQEHIDFALENYLKMSQADIDKHFGTCAGITSRILKHYNIKVPKDVMYRLRGNKIKKAFTPEQDRYITENIHTISTREMSKELKIGRSKLVKRCRELGLGDILLQKSKDHRFTKGQIPKNKGKKMNAATREKMKHTFFQKGHIPHNAKHDEAISQRRDKDGRVYLYYREKLNQWIPLHHKIWKEAHGEIPKGYNVIFKNGNSLDVRIENLECIDNAENLRRNSIRQYPQELRELILANNKLKKEIKKAIKQ